IPWFAFHWGGILPWKRLIAFAAFFRKWFSVYNPANKPPTLCEDSVKSVENPDLGNFLVFYLPNLASFPLFSLGVTLTQMVVCLIHRP
ncbi:MAG: hypothetical protein ACREDQ_08945, partial [Limisphaerales bacterium]